MYTHPDKNSLNQSGESMLTVVHWDYWLNEQGRQNVLPIQEQNGFPLQFIGESAKNTLNRYITGLLQIFCQSACCHSSIWALNSWQFLLIMYAANMFYWLYCSKKYLNLVFAQLVWQIITWWLQSAYIVKPHDVQ